MQTFLPYSSFVLSATCLDNKRLGKQRVEAYQILKINTKEEDSRWKNHPAVLMWKGYETALSEYILDICKVWTTKGFKDSIKNKTLDIVLEYQLISKGVYPPWLGEEIFHSSHRASLLFKNYDHYKQFNWNEKPIINYYWPVVKGKDL